MERAIVAQQIQSKLNKANRMWGIRHMYALHRLELALVDDEAFELSMLYMSDNAYDFLHLFTSLAHKGRGHNIVTIPSLIKLLETGIIVNNCVSNEIKIADTPNDSALGKLLSDIELNMRPVFLEIPTILEYVMLRNKDEFIVDPAQAYEWRHKVLTESVSFLQVGHAKLVQKGIGD